MIAVQIDPKEHRRIAVLSSLVALGGSAEWMAMGERGHNLATILHCIAKGLVTQRSPTGKRVFDITPAGRALIEEVAQ